MYCFPTKALTTEYMETKPSLTTNISIFNQYFDNTEAPQKQIM